MSEAMEMLDSALREWQLAHRAMEEQKVIIESLSAAEDTAVQVYNRIRIREEEAKSAIDHILNTGIGLDEWDEGQEKLKRAVGEAAVAVVKEDVITITFPKDL